MTNLQLTSYSMVKSQKHFLKAQAKDKDSTLATFIQHIFGSPNHSNQRRKRNKGNSNWKRRSKTFTVCRWHDAIPENPKDTRKLPELINEFGNIAGYNINTQKSVAFLYTNNDRSEREIQ